ncbi:MAG: hypothetical protein KDK39_05835 [Leptospiraceae bacterium]|nr:hypothetical protein [Leptospiraceae bacterium]
MLSPWLKKRPATTRMQTNRLYLAWLARGTVATIAIYQDSFRRWSRPDFRIGAL